MEYYLGLLFSYVIVLQVSLFIGFFIHQSLQNGDHKNRLRSTFYSLLIGWYVLAIGLALFYSLGNTSMWIPLAVAAVILYYYSKRKLIAFRLSFPLTELFYQVKVSIILGIAVYVANWLLIHDFNFDVVAYSVNDFAFYARLSDAMTHFQVENTSLDYFYPNLDARGPYHFIEHWFTGGICRIFGLNSSQAYPLLYIPLVLSIAIIGIAAIFERFSFVTWKSFFFAILSLFVSGFAFIYPNFYEPLFVFIKDWSIVQFIILLPVYLLFIAALFELDKKRYDVAGIIILLSGLTFGTVLPAAAIISTLIFLAGMVLHRHEKNSRKTYLHLLLISFTALLTVVFYYSSASIRLASTPSNEAIEKGMGLWPYLKISINIILKIGFAIVVVLSPYLILSYFSTVKKHGSFFIRKYLENHRVFLLMFVFAVLPVFANAAIHSVPNAHQLYRSIFFVAGNLAGIWLLASLVSSESKSIRLACYGFYAINLVAHIYYIPAYETDYISADEVKKAKHSISNTNVKMVYLKSDFNLESYYATQINVFLPHYGFAAFISPVAITCLNPEKILESKNPFMPLTIRQYENSPLYKYCSEKEIDPKDSNSKLQFIRDFNVEIILTDSTYALEDVFESCLKESLNFEDGMILHIVDSQKVSENLNTLD